LRKFELNQRTSQGAQYLIGVTANHAAPGFNKMRFGYARRVAHLPDCSAVALL
jgi:hypothetical protein